MTVDYKLMQDLAIKEGTHHHTTKKEFCRLLKGATLVSGIEAQSMVAEASPADRTPAAIIEPPDAIAP